MTGAPIRKNIVTMGGGTGTFTVLSGFRHTPEVFLTAIVSSADDGGSTGRLRDAYGILPPGDARQALVALAEEETMLRKLFTHRFAKGDIAGHNFGNLFLVALSDMLGSDALALEEASRILRINGRVLQVSERPARLLARLADGTTLAGEHAIDERVYARSPIAELSLVAEAIVAPSARDAIAEADLIVLGPGDLYTSTIATLLPAGVREALESSKAKLTYVVNLFTKAGQTDGYGARRHVEEVERYAGRALDAIVMSTDGFPEEALARYALEREAPVADDLGDDCRVIRRNLASITVVEPVPEDPVPRSLIRHDSEKLAAVLHDLLDQ